jgi:hypothetical protein
MISRLLREVIKILRYASEGTSHAVYNAQDTLSNNFMKASGPYIPDTFQDAGNKRHKVMDHFTLCPRDLKENFARILDHVIL